MASSRVGRLAGGRLKRDLIVCQDETVEMRGWRTENGRGNRTMVPADVQGQPRWKVVVDLGVELKNLYRRRGRRTGELANTGLVPLGG